MERKGSCSEFREHLHLAVTRWVYTKTLLASRTSNSQTQFCLRSWIWLLAVNDLCCLQTHLPGYINDYDKLSKAGAQVIACVAVNDPFVMAAWGEVNKAEGKVWPCGLVLATECIAAHHCSLGVSMLHIWLWVCGSSILWCMHTPDLVRSALLVASGAHTWPIRCSM